MFARIVTYQAEREKLGEVRQRIKELIPKAIGKIKGLREFICLVRDDGKLVNVAIYDTQSAAYAVVPQIMVLRDQMADIMGGGPLPEEFEVLLHERMM